MLEGLRKPRELIVTVVTLLTYGCPVQAIVHAFELDERTVADWRDRAGKQCQRVHEALVQQGSLDLVHVQADEIRIKGRKMVAWMGLAIMVSTRLWMAGVVSQTRDRALADRVLRQVRACAVGARALLVATDGWAAYPNSIKRAFREKLKETAGRGRARLRIWKELCIVTISKRMEKHHLVEVTRTLSWGTQIQANDLLKRSRGGAVWNTAFIERVNGTFRERFAALTRKCRHAAHRLTGLETGMYLIGCTYNFCFAHQELSHRRHTGSPCTPAMAAGLTDHIWRIEEVLTFQVAPAPWVAPKRSYKRRDPTMPKRPRGRPRIHPLPDPTLPKRPRGRPRKAV